MAGEVHRRRGRGAIWYGTKDQEAGRHFRVSAAANAMLGLMDGRRTVAEISARLARHLGPERPGQGETVRLLVQLHQSELLATPLPPDLTELDGRAGNHARRRLWPTLAQPMVLRLPA